MAAVDPRTAVLCSNPKCPRHQRDQFNPAARCADPPPPHWSPPEQRQWLKRAIATPRDNYGWRSL
jgi:hypothetical protein